MGYPILICLFGITSALRQTVKASAFAAAYADRYMHQQERIIQMLLIENVNGHTGAHQNPNGTWVCS